MKQSILTLFETWLISQENTIYCAKERICTCLKHCQNDATTINAHRVEKYIDDICRKLQQIRQYQKCIESFIDASAKQLEPHHIEKHNAICKAISHVEKETILLFALLQHKTHTLQTKLHYTAIFQSQLHQ